jgi:hypothetical protein
MQPEVVIDGSRFCDDPGFVDEFNRGYRAIFGGPAWDGDDFNDFDDLLDGPASRIKIRWIHSGKSRIDLDFHQMAGFWGRFIERTESLGLYVLPELRQRVEDANCGRGATLFDWLREQLSHPQVDLELGP